jgi:hypothetical protein
MRQAGLGLFSLLCGMIPSVGLSQNWDVASPTPTAADETHPHAAPTAQQTASLSGWRYRKFNGQWWYFLPNQQWARWDGRYWTIPTPMGRDYQKWRYQQMAGQYTDSAARDEAMRRREVERWRARSVTPYSAHGGHSDADYHAQVDRLHDNLMITPYDYRLGTAGHGLFDANPDRTIANSGRMNYATSLGGYMGGALRSPYGY